MRFKLLAILGIVVVASGCVDSGGIDWDLSQIVVSEDEVPDGFKLTHQTNADSSDFSNGSIVRRVDRRFVKEAGNRTTVVLSSATVYDSEEAAQRVRQNFLNRTGTPVSEPEDVYYDGKKATHVQDIDYATLEGTYYIYRRNGSLIYFVGVHDSDNAEGLAEVLFKDMRKAE